MEDYAKIGEDKKLECCKKISDALPGDREEKPFEGIINKKEEFN